MGFVAGAITAGLTRAQEPSALNIVYGVCLATGFQASKYLSILAKLHTSKGEGEVTKEEGNSKEEDKAPIEKTDQSSPDNRSQDRLRDMVSDIKQAITLAAEGHAKESEILKCLEKIDGEKLDNVIKIFSEARSTSHSCGQNPCLCKEFGDSASNKFFKPTINHNSLAEN